MRIERLINSVLVIFLTVIACLNWRKAALFKADNEELRARVHSLELELDTTSRLAQRALDKSERLRNAQLIEARSTNDSTSTLTADNTPAVAPPPSVRTAAQP